MNSQLAPPQDGQPKERVWLEFITPEVVFEDDGEAMALRARARAICLPQLEFRAASLAEAVDFLRQKCEQLDPAKRGLDFAIEKSTPASTPKITLSLRDVSADDAVRYVAELSGLVAVPEKTGYLLRPLTESEKQAPLPVPATPTEPDTPAF